MGAAEMIESQIKSRGVKNPHVLEAVGKVDRRNFVPEDLKALAYEDRPLPIGEGQTISQPFVVASMSEQLELTKKDKVLEIGTGCGYQTAILAELAGEVYSLEIVPSLARQSEALLRDMGYENVHVKQGDGYHGWSQGAPFDKIILTAAPGHIPQPLVDQLKVGGRMILPMGGDSQDLILIKKSKKGVKQHKLYPVSFVPMTGDAETHDA